MNRQVPFKNSLPLIVGSGRLARNLSHYFELLNIPYTIWSRKQAQDDYLNSLFQSDLIESKTEDKSKLDINKSLQRHLNQSEIVLLAISDDSLPTFVNELQNYLQLKPQTRIVHFSGTLSIPNTFCTHPLMTFTHELKDLDFYKRIPFVVETNAFNYGLHDLIPGIDNPYSFISIENKPLYHAACVIGGNFTNILWREVYKIFQSKIQVPVEYLEPYLKATFENILNSPQESLTGPLQRNDTLVIQKNMQALSPLGLDQIYSEFIKIQQSHRMQLSKDVI